MNINYVFFRIKKQLRYGFCGNAGRNHRGVITVHHRGGGAKNCHLYIDFIRRINSFGYVVKIKKIAAFTGFVGLVLFFNGLMAYSLIGDKFRLNQQLYQGSVLDLNHLDESKDFGSSIPCSYLALFSSISNVEVRPFQGGRLARAAGTSVTISRKKDMLVTLKLKSGWNITVSIFCICMRGIMSNSYHWYSKLGKAGISRSLGIRPTVRGVAKNPHDHPHGGGEGKKSPPAAARSPWGWLTKGTPTNRTLFQLKRKKLGKTLR